MNIFITGGMGFIGHHLVRHLIKERPRDKIVIIDNLHCGNPDFLKDIQDKFTFYETDITDIENLEKCFIKEQPEIIIHLAALHFIPECNQFPEKTKEINIIGTQNLVSLANKYNTQHFIFSSSASVYGISDGANKEDSNLSPLDIYGRSKLAGEQIIQNNCLGPWSILRLFNIIGKNETHDHLIPAILKQLQTGDKIILGNIDTKRDYLFTEDLVRGIQILIKNKKAYSEIINFGTGLGSSAKEIIQELELITQRHLEITTDNKLKRLVDNPILIASIEKAKKIINWEPKYTLNTALRNILN